jgi:hypothetical protein
VAAALLLDDRGQREKAEKEVNRPVMQKGIEVACLVIQQSLSGWQVIGKWDGLQREANVLLVNL